MSDFGKMPADKDKEIGPVRSRDFGWDLLNTTTLGPYRSYQVDQETARRFAERAERHAAECRRRGLNFMGDPLDKRDRTRSGS